MLEDVKEQLAQLKTKYPLTEYDVDAMHPTDWYAGGWHFTMNSERYRLQLVANTGRHQPVGETQQAFLWVVSLADVTVCGTNLTMTRPDAVQAMDALIVEMMGVTQRLTGVVNKLMRPRRKASTKRDKLRAKHLAIIRRALPGAKCWCFATSPGRYYRAAMPAGVVPEFVEVHTFRDDKTWAIALDPDGGVYCQEQSDFSIRVALIALFRHFKTSKTGTVDQNP